MVEGSVLSFSPSFQLYSDVAAAKGGGDFNKLGVFEVPENEVSFIPDISDENEKKQPKLEDEEEKEHVEEEEEEENEEEEEEEFSFSCTNPDGSPISADDVFANGQIRPIFPIFNRDLLFGGGYDGDLKSKVDSLSLRPPLRKLFVEERDGSESASESDELESVPAETYCEWSGAASGGGKAVEASPELCKKSNSTGFSKLWRFRDLVHRSNSDGKDAFVFLNHSSPSSSSSAANDKSRNETAKKNDKKVEQNDKKPPVVVAVKEEKAIAKAKGKVKTASLSAHEKHYVSSRAKREGDKRKSYLPYRQDLVGFFTNVNGLSRNVHPF